jgi:hydroxyacylglutathione hydrolase
MNHESKIEVFTIPALTDNYIYVVRDPLQNTVAVVDPSEARPVQNFLMARGWHLNMILNTHHHHDHVGGNLELKNQYQCPIYCSAFDLTRIPGATRGLATGDSVQLGWSRFRVLEVPGHTLGAIAYHSAESEIAFTGDTLFTLGCGRLFEGTAQQMWESLSLLKTLPPDTKIYSGHEYGLQNALFALHLKPNSTEIQELIADLRLGLAQGAHSVPSLLGVELQHNPFLNTQDAADFAHLRRLKDEFRLEHHTSLG